ncbi:MAG TPA: hypothetical protein VML50_19075 [Anaeromyxobacter sp.]|nr:hypothetical protein [Anaeromyxobacter sp.]
MKRTFFLALSLLLAPVTALATRGPSTPAERRKAVEATRKLEQEPLAPGANASRKWLLQWIQEIPDINVRSCSGPLDSLAQDQEGERHGRQLYAQSVFGMAAFLVEHPRQKDDWVAVQAAGIESVLRAYRSLLKQEPGARWKELDLLLEARQQGKLEQVIEETMEGCGDEAQPAPGDAI